MMVVMVILMMCLCRLDCGDIDLYLIHCLSAGHVLESYKAMMMMIMMMEIVILMMCICRLDCGDIDLYLLYSPSADHVLESYKIMVTVMAVVTRMLDDDACLQA